MIGRREVLSSTIWHADFRLDDQILKMFLSSAFHCNHLFDMYIVYISTMTYLQWQCSWRERTFQVKRLFFINLKDDPFIYETSCPRGSTEWHDSVLRWFAPHTLSVFHYSTMSVNKGHMQLRNDGQFLYTSLTEIERPIFKSTVYTIHCHLLQVTYSHLIWKHQSVRNRNLFKKKQF